MIVFIFVTYIFHFLFSLVLSGTYILFCEIVDIVAFVLQDKLYSEIFFNISHGTIH